MSFSLLWAICIVGVTCSAGIAYALQQGMELLGRLAAVVGISLVLTLLLLVLYQDDAALAMQAEPALTQAVTAAGSAQSGTP